MILHSFMWRNKKYKKRLLEKYKADIEYTKKVFSQGDVMTIGEYKETITRLTNEYKEGVVLKDGEQIDIIPADKWREIVQKSKLP